MGGMVGEVRVVKRRRAGILFYRDHKILVCLRIEKNSRHFKIFVISLTKCVLFQGAGGRMRVG